MTRDGSIYDETTWEVTGMAHVRSDTTKPIADIEIKLISMTIDGKPRGEIKVS